MPVTEMIVGISGGIFLLAAFVALLRLIQGWLLHRTLREAIQRDSDAAAILIDKIDHISRGDGPAGGDDRNGLVLIALGAAQLGFALILSDHGWWRYCAGGALFPALVGAALLGRHIWQVRAHRRALAAHG